MRRYAKFLRRLDGGFSFSFLRCLDGGLFYALLRAVCSFLFYAVLTAIFIVGSIVAIALWSLFAVCIPAPQPCGTMELTGVGSIVAIALWSHVAVCIPAPQSRCDGNYGANRYRTMKLTDNPCQDRVEKLSQPRGQAIIIIYQALFGMTVIGQSEYLEKISRPYLYRQNF